MNYILQPHFETHRCMMVKLGMISGSGNFVHRHRVEPRVKLYVPRQESFPIPLKYIDVTRATSTSLDVTLEKISMITGTLMEMEKCQIRGEVSQDSLF